METLNTSQDIENFKQKLINEENSINFKIGLVLMEYNNIVFDKIIKKIQNVLRNSKNFYMYNKIRDYLKIKHKASIMDITAINFFYKENPLKLNKFILKKIYYTTISKQLEEKKKYIYFECMKDIYLKCMKNLGVRSYDYIIKHLIQNSCYLYQIIHDVKHHAKMRYKFNYIKRIYNECKVYGVNFPENKILIDWYE